MGFSFFLHCKSLNPILQSTNTQPFDASEQLVIQKYTNCVYKFIGQHYGKSDFAVKIKETTHAVRWLHESGINSVCNNLFQLEAHLEHVQGLKLLMVDLALLCHGRMMATIPHANNYVSDDMTYAFQHKLK